MSAYYFRILLNYCLMATLCSCGRKSGGNDISKPPTESSQVPRWENVNRTAVTFDYYVTNSDTPFQLADENMGAVAVQPTLRLQGIEGELMDYVMMFEATSQAGCQKYKDNVAFNWQGIIFEKAPADQVALFAETNRTLSSGKQQSVIHFLIIKEGNSACTKLTFYDIDLKGYAHKLSIFDTSELATAINKIAASVKIK